VPFCAHSSRCFLFASFEVPFCAHPAGRFSLCTLRGAFLSVRENVSREFWNCKLLEFGEECARLREKRLLPFLRTARRCSSSGAFGELRVLCVLVFLEKMSFVACWPCASGGKLLPPKVMCVRAVFFGEKRLPPSWRTITLGGFRGRIIPSFWWTLDRWVVHCRGSVRKVLCFAEKHLPAFLRTIVSRGLVFCFACLERWMPSPRRKMSPPFLACIFQFFRGCFDSYLRG